MNDIILKVNDVDLIEIPHSVAVDALKRAGNMVHLVSIIYPPLHIHFYWKRNDMQNYYFIHNIFLKRKFLWPHNKHFPG